LGTPSLDSELARRCQRGEVAAYQELVRRHRATVYRLACAIVRDRDDAEDVVQEAFVRAYRAISRFDSGRDFAGWLKRITVNCAVSKLAERRRGLARTGRSAGDEGPSPAPDPDCHLITDELQSHVRQAIDQLPVRQRVAISLFSLDDMGVVLTATGCARGAELKVPDGWVVSPENREAEGEAGYRILHRESGIELLHVPGGTGPAHRALPAGPHTEHAASFL
jgi:RNA polymerase sigma-70 factor (ECF subfamily)